MSAGLEAKPREGERRDDEELGRFRTAWWQRLIADASTYELTRFAVLRLLAFVYLVAFISLAAQLEPLLGSK